MIKLQPIATVPFIRIRKINSSLVSAAQSYFVEPKNITLDSKHNFIMKIPNKPELQQIVNNHSSDIDFKDLQIFT